MLRIVDRIFGVLLALAACGHTVGTILWTQPMSGLFHLVFGVVPGSRPPGCAEYC